MKNSKSCYSRLFFGVMTFNQQRKFILAAEKNFLFSIKTLSLCFFLEGFFLFFDLDCQNLATLGFDNCPISEKENLSQKKKFRPRVFLPLSNLFLATKNIYSVPQKTEKNCKQKKLHFSKNKNNFECSSQFLRFRYK